MPATTKAFVIIDDRIRPPVFRISTPKASILLALRKGPLTAMDISRLIGVHKTATYRHLISLHRAALVNRNRNSRYVHYTLTPAGAGVTQLLEPS
jgi:predicted transcriptional regulator